MPLRPGDPAPDFELLRAVGEPPIRRSVYQGPDPLLLLFFPLAFSPACTEELCALASRMPRFERLDARILAVSVDSPFVNARFAREHEIPYPVLSDFNRTVSEAYGVLLPDFFGLRGVARRSAFAIDGEGTIRYAWATGEDDALPELDELERAVADLAGHG